MGPFNLAFEKLIGTQVMMPLLQGTIWSLALHGWRHWNNTTQLSGSSAGAKVRRWWYKTNNWPLTGSLKDYGKDTKLMGDVGDVSSWTPTIWDFN